MMLNYFLYVKFVSILFHFGVLLVTLNVLITGIIKYANVLSVWLSAHARTLLGWFSCVLNILSVAYLICVQRLIAGLLLHTELEKHIEGNDRVMDLRIVRELCWRGLIKVWKRIHFATVFALKYQARTLKHLKYNGHYMGRTAQLTSRCCILYIYSTNILTE